VRQRISATRAAAACVGVGPLAARPGGEEPHPEGMPPEWLSELDDYEGIDDISLALYCELGVMLRARIGRPAGEAGADPDVSQKHGWLEP
jgi:hypothetical protein